MPDSYYDLLGVDQDASEEEIKRAFREKVKEVHPDHNDDADAGERFRRVREARDTLCDPKARQRYDRQRNQTDETKTDSSNERQQHKEQQRHQQRKEQQRRQAEQRRKRQQRKEQQRQQAEQRRKRRQRNTRSRSRRQSQSHTRTSHDTETQRDRNETSSHDGERQDHQPVEGWLRTASAWLRDRIPRPKQWLWTHFHSSAATREFFIDVITSPTILRLSAAIGLMIVLTMGVRTVTHSPSTTPTLGFGIVLGSLGVSYAAYAVATPLPFEAPRNRGRFKPANRAPVWPVVALNLVGLGLYVVPAIQGAPASSLWFTIASIIYAGTVLLLLSIVFIILSLIVRGIMNLRVTFRNVMTYSMKGSLIGTPIVLFIRPSGKTLHFFLSKYVTSPDSLQLAPWIPPVMIGPVYLGSFANFVLAIVYLGCFLGSVSLLCKYLMIVPWQDRYDHGYHLHPSCWNFAVTAPFVVLAWMVSTSVSTVTIGPGTLKQWTLLIGLLVLPTILGGAYLLRRQLEPYVQEWHQGR